MLGRTQVASQWAGVLLSGCSTLFTLCTSLLLLLQSRSRSGYLVGATPLVDRPDLLSVCGWSPTGEAVASTSPSSSRAASWLLSVSAGWPLSVGLKAGAGVLDTSLDAATAVVGGVMEVDSASSACLVGICSLSG